MADSGEAEGRQGEGKDFAWSFDFASFSLHILITEQHLYQHSMQFLVLSDESVYEKVFPS